MADNILQDYGDQLRAFLAPADQSRDLTVPQPVRLIPVDHDPFAAQLVPVDHNPFAQ